MMPTQAQAFEFFGDPREDGWYAANVTSVPCPWPLRVGDVTTDHIHCHRKVADSLMRVLGKTWIDVGRDMKKIRELHFDIYDGCYNFRAKRGGNSLSMHSFAAAIDWDAEHNMMNTKHPFFTRDTPLIANFIAEGWVWGGDWTSPKDYMHVQAVRVK